MRSCYTLPESSAALRSEAALESQGGTVLLYYDYYRYLDGRIAGIFRSGLYFLQVEAHRHRSERSCLLWHTEAYDRLVEVEGSDWLPDFQGFDFSGQRLPELHHYVIMLKGSGCFEFIASAWEALPEEEGPWEPLSYEEQEAWNTILSS